VEETHKKYIFQRQREECKTFPGGYISRGIYSTVKEAHIQTDTHTYSATTTKRGELEENKA
jgi:hypothetical protein